MTRDARCMLSTAVAAVLSTTAFSGAGIAQDQVAPASERLRALEAMIVAQERLLSDSEVEYTTITWDEKGERTTLMEHTVMLRASNKERWLRRYDFGEHLAGKMQRAFGDLSFPQAAKDTLLSSATPIVDVFDGGRHLRVGVASPRKWDGMLYKGLDVDMRTGALAFLFMQSSQWHSAFFARWQAIARPRGVGIGECDTLLHVTVEPMSWIRRVRCAPNDEAWIEECTLSSMPSSALAGVLADKRFSMAPTAAETLLFQCRTEAITNIGGVSLPTIAAYRAPASRHGWARSWIAYRRTGHDPSIDDRTFNPRLKPSECGEGKVTIVDELTRETLVLNTNAAPTVVKAPSPAGERARGPETEDHVRDEASLTPWHVALIIAAILAAAAVLFRMLVRRERGVA